MENTIEQIEVRALLSKKGITPITTLNIPMEHVRNARVGVMLTSLPQMCCEICGQEDYLLCPDGDHYFISCYTPECMKETSNASKKRDDEERRRAKERDEKGNIVTGANHFGLGSLYKNASLARWIADEKHQQTVSDWIKGPPCFLTVMGNPGTGKTFLSASILNHFFDLRAEVYYVNHRKLMQFIQNGIAEGKPQHTLLNKIAYKDILIFDDMGSGTNTDWQQEMILELLDIRYSQQLRTLITTNFTKQEIAQELGVRTSSRIFDSNNKSFGIWTGDLRQHNLD